MAAPDFSTMTNAEVEQLARDLDIDGRSTMDRPALERAIRSQSKKGATSSRISGDPDQGSARAVVYTDERQLSRTGGERVDAAAEAVPADERVDVTSDAVAVDAEGASDAEAAAAAAAAETANT